MKLLDWLSDWFWRRERRRWLKGVPGRCVDITPDDIRMMRHLGIEDTPANRRKLAVEIAKRRP